MKAVLTAILLFTCFVASCGDSDAGNGSEAPEGINTSNINVNDAPGIPSNSNTGQVREGTTPTPGIPANGDIVNAVPKGATPTPGIPDEETLRRQLERTDIDANVVNRPATTPPANVRRRDPMGRPRRANSN